MSTTSAVPVRFQITMQDGTMAGWRWRNDGAPPLLFLHATGFCASAYKQMLGLASRAYDVYALDLRGHGLTQLPADPDHAKSWSIFASDVRDFLDTEGRPDWTLAGHSMGAVVAALAGAGRSDVAQTRLIEPVVMPAAIRYLALTPLWRAFSRARPPASLAIRRRAHWPDRAAMLESYSKKPLFQRFVPGAIADYLEDGVISDGDGVRLSCDPAWEAATFMAQAHDFRRALKSVPGPVSVLAARHLSSTVAPGYGAALRSDGAVFQRVDGVGHLLAMEDPAAAAHFLISGSL